MQCQARLADSASPGQREQTRVRERGPDGGELAPASDEARQLGWQVASRFARRLLCHSRDRTTRCLLRDRFQQQMSST